jgi:ABC-type protease/lipase transport system fused ATPase/permease subunit
MFKLIRALSERKTEHRVLILLNSLTINLKELIAPMPPASPRVMGKSLLTKLPSHTAANIRTKKMSHSKSLSAPPQRLSWSGRSTILKLLFRFYNSGNEAIKLDDRDVRDIRVDDLGAHIGVVPQDAVLFNDTLMYNLLYAKPESTKEKVYEACSLAGIHNKILSFQTEYQASVGERGLKLSGGERQRVGFCISLCPSLHTLTNCPDRNRPCIP